MTMGKPEIIWGNCINPNGIYSKKPVRCIKTGKYEEVSGWWDKSGNLQIMKIGLDIKKEYITFSNTKRELVHGWTEGVLSAMWFMKKWAS